MRSTEDEVIPVPGQLELVSTEDCSTWVAVFAIVAIVGSIAGAAAAAVVMFLTERKALQ